MPTRCVNNFPQNGRGLGHMTPQLFGIQSNISSKLLELDTSNLAYIYIHKSFLLEKPSRRSNNFPPKGRGLGHVTPKIFDIQSNISSKLLELETSSLEYIFVYRKPSGRINNFPQKARGLGHASYVTPKFLANDPKYLYIIWATDFKFGQ